MRTFTFVLKLTDQPGGMELVAATFAHRGISLCTSLGNNGDIDPDGRATVLVTFAATPAKKEILRRALGRLSRVLSLVEHPEGSSDLRKTALLRLAARAAAPALPEGVPGTVEAVRVDEESGETTYLLVGVPDVVDALIVAARDSGDLREITQTLMAL